MRRRIRDITGMTSNCAASDIEVLPKRPTRREPGDCRFEALRAMGGGGLLDRKAPRTQEFSIRFLIWVESAALADKSKAYYGNGWCLLSTTKIVGMRLDHITKDDVEGLSLSGSASNANCALRTLRRIFTKRKNGISSPGFQSSRCLLSTGAAYDWTMVQNGGCSSRRRPAIGRLECSSYFAMSSSLQGTQGCGTSESSIVFV